VLVYGIDFGTTNSSVALFHEGRAWPAPVGADGADFMKSVLFFPEPPRTLKYVRQVPSVGDEAIARYLECGMQGRLLQSVKSFLPDGTFKGTRIGHQQYVLEDFIALVLHSLKEKADRHFGIETDAVVLGRPARFSSIDEEETLAEERLAAAASQAGFRHVSLQREPIAAALAYEQSLTDERVVLVVDLGGGTSDFTMMRLGPRLAKNRDRSADILATRGVRIGGDRLDSRIMRHKLTRYFGEHLRWQYGGKWFDMPAHLMTTICEWSMIPFLKTRRERGFVSRLITYSDDPESSRRLQALIDRNLGYSLFREIDRAKCELSDLPETVIRYDAPPIAFREPLTQIEFEHAIAGEVESTRQAILSTLQDSGLEAPSIASVFMTGGTSYVPAFRNMVASLFGAEKMVSGEMITSVVSGLALSAPQFFRDV
jgi:hypothetical chaperone protein